MGNERKIIQDFTSHLSEKGVEQARIVAQRLKEIPLTLVVSSTAQRAMDTARLVAKPHDIALVSSELSQSADIRETCSAFHSLTVVSSCIARKSSAISTIHFSASMDSRTFMK